MSAADTRPGSDEDGPVILFQGDSITDAGRHRDDAPNHPQNLGSGYAAIAGSVLLSEQPERGWICYNRGVGGDTVRDLAERWNKDCLELEPDILSILVGINEVWYSLSGEFDVPPDVYEDRYRSLLHRTRSHLPEGSLLLGEPFFLPGGSAVGEGWRSTLKHYQNAARRLAHEFDAHWIPYQSVFDDALDEAPGPYWAEDGVHPSPAGHHRMAEAWLDTFRTGVLEAG